MRELPHRAVTHEHGVRYPLAMAKTPPPTERAIGRPVVHMEAWSKITVVLLDRHVAYLDRIAIEIRLKHRRAISRAEIIRALVDAAESSGVDLSEAQDVESIVSMLKAAWGGGVSTRSRSTR